ncbi:hypothetical protein BDB01DRAFT_728326 [Pilobolus umbonatus]|nr:hypothetical protein BDB01DRAFT_728326 [Pilobolus umbonatus]
MYLSLLLIFITPIWAIVPAEKTFEPKTIYISSTLGGMSHIGWTLEIGKILAQRGHNVSFITIDPYTRFGLPYQDDIQTISLGPSLSEYGLQHMFDLDHPMSPTVVNVYQSLIKATYERDFKAYLSLFSSTHPSVVICDQLALTCFDAAKRLHIPLIAHMTMSLSYDTSAPFITSFGIGSTPTTLNQSLRRRLYEKYILTPKLIYAFLPVSRTLREIRANNGVEHWDILSRHSNVMKMVNSFWGMESPRPIGPFVEYVGPIMGTVYEPLSGPLSDFVNLHNRTVYVAFGQIYHPNQEEFSVLLIALIEGWEQGLLDGVIWSVPHQSRQQLLGTTIQTLSGQFYRVIDLFNNLIPSFRFEVWAPQFAILSHPHCKLFVSHGGASSVHESLYNGVTLLLHPFTSDQPNNAYTMCNKAGVALCLDRRQLNQSDAFYKLQQLLTDPEGTFSRNMMTVRSLVQINSRKRDYAADRVEEVIYSVRDQDDIWHRREASAQLSWIISTNWDIDVLAFSLVITLIIGIKMITKICCNMLRSILSPGLKDKQE